MAARGGNGKLLGLALVVTLALVWWVSQAEEDDETILLARPLSENPRSAVAMGEDAARHAGKTQAASGLPLELLQARTAGSGKVGADLFKSHSWYVPPPKATEATLPPPKPAAPPAPFSYAGKLEDGPDGTLLMLVAGNKLHTVTVGDVLDGQWRLDGESSDSLKFTYLPLGLQQTLSKSTKSGSAQPAKVKKTQSQGTES